MKQHPTNRISACRKRLIAAVLACGAPIAYAADSDAATSLQGDGFTSSSNLAGTITTGVLSFIFDVKGKEDGSASGIHSESRLSKTVTSPGTLDLISSAVTRVECLVVDDHTAWWSGTQTFGTFDPRDTPANNAQGADQLARREVVQFAKFIDLPGEPEKRSLFATASITGQIPFNDPSKTPDVPSADGVSFLASLGSRGKDICKLKDQMFRVANYTQIESHPPEYAVIRWVDQPNPDTGEPTTFLSDPIKITRKNVLHELANPPSTAIYTATGDQFLRTFTAGRVEVNGKSK